MSPQSILEESSSVLVEEPQSVLELLLHLRVALESDASDESHELVHTHASSVCTVAEMSEIQGGPKSGVLGRGSSSPRQLFK